MVMELCHAILNLATVIGRYHSNRAVRRHLFMTSIPYTYLYVYTQGGLYWAFRAPLPCRVRVTTERLWLATWLNGVWLLGIDWLLTYVIMIALGRGAALERLSIGPRGQVLPSPFGYWNCLRKIFPGCWLKSSSCPKSPHLTVLLIAVIIIL